jgi:hypothetical protein
MNQSNPEEEYLLSCQICGDETFAIHVVQIMDSDDDEHRNYAMPYCIEHLPEKQFQALVDEGYITEEDVDA